MKRSTRLYCGSRRCLSDDESVVPMTDNTAERAVLSAVLLAQTVPPVVGAMLTPADFHDARCGEIYGAAQALTARAEPCG